MLPSTISKTVAHQLDRLVLFTMNQRLPASFERNYRQEPGLESVLAHTTVNREKTVEYALSAPGEHTVWLDTADGELQCRIRVQPAVRPQAPLLLYHHGFNEWPYDNSWRRIFRQPSPFPAHAVCIQAPYHYNWIDPLARGFASLQNIFQIFAGSLRIMELVQSHFEAQGAAFTLLCGVSWGGITSLLYESLFQQTRAVIPMLSSPDLAQVLQDIAALFRRPIAVPVDTLRASLDFTRYYRRVDADKVFPLMGEYDLFFRLEHHSAIFAERPLVTVPGGHITGFWQVAPLRHHILHVLQQVESSSRSI
ncbi:MAG: hypothetical protein ACE5E7_00940 [Anaerolineae bacterium]